MGYVHIYTGEGKGKTTAAVGLAVRAAGSGLKVAFYEFLKGSGTGEWRSMQALGIKLYSSFEHEKFTWDMTNEEKQDCAKRCEGVLALASSDIACYDLVVLDEAICAVQAGMLAEAKLAEMITRSKNDGCAELVLTGRGASKGLCVAADYVSEISCCAHPYTDGLSARKGIEY